jgi:BRCT domain type II-containing protein
MLNNDYDPYDHLQTVSRQGIRNALEIEMLSGKLAEATGMLEELARQAAHLSNALVGMQNINKLLMHRLELLESKDD